MRCKSQVGWDLDGLLFSLGSQLELFHVKWLSEMNPPTPLERMHIYIYIYICIFHANHFNRIQGRRTLLSISSGMPQHLRHDSIIIKIIRLQLQQVINIPLVFITKLVLKNFVVSFTIIIIIVVRRLFQQLRLFSIIIIIIIIIKGSGN